MNQKIISALFNLGVLGEGNILDAYYNIFINIIYNKNVQYKKELELISMFNVELNIEFPSSFVRYVLSRSRKSGEVKYCGGEYYFDIKRENKQRNKEKNGCLGVGIDTGFFEYDGVCS